MHSHYKVMHSKLKADAVLVLGGYTSEKWVMHSKLNGLITSIKTDA